MNKCLNEQYKKTAELKMKTIKDLQLGVNESILSLKKTKLK